MKKIYHTWQDIERQTQEILRQITLSDWRPDYVVGLTRGGLVPANLISQYLECRMETLKQARLQMRTGNRQGDEHRVRIPVVPDILAYSLAHLGIFRTRDNGLCEGNNTRYLRKLTDRTTMQAHG